MPENKVKYGLKNVHYAPITEGADGEVTYGTPVPIPGAVSMSLNAQGDTTEFYADNSIYYTVAANNGYQGDLEVARIPQSFRTDILQEKIDETSGVIFENAAVEPKRFALLFEFAGDKHATRHVLYNCTVGRPNVSSSTTTASKEPVTDTMQITATPRADGIVKGSTSDATPTSTYDAWFAAVVLPNAQTPETNVQTPETNASNEEE